MVDGTVMCGKHSHGNLFLGVGDSCLAGEEWRPRQHHTTQSARAPFLYSQSAMRTARDISRWQPSASLL